MELATENARAGYVAHVNWFTRAQQELRKLGDFPQTPSLP
jgi:hypothetical protein